MMAIFSFTSSQSDANHGVLLQTSSSKAGIRNEFKNAHGLACHTEAIPENDGRLGKRSLCSQQQRSCCQAPQTVEETTEGQGSNLTAYTSRVCHHCGHITTGKQKVWAFKVCRNMAPGGCRGKFWNRDYNASQNLLQIFLHMNANNGRRPAPFFYGHDRVQRAAARAAGAVGAPP